MTIRKTHFGIAALAFIIGVGANAFANTTTTPTAAGCDRDSGVCYAFVSPAISPTSCDGSQIRFDITTTGGDGMWKVALAAFLSGKQLVVADSGTCLVGFVSPLYLYAQ